MFDEDFEREHLKDRVYVEAIRYERENQLMQELYEEEIKNVKVVLGRVRKRRKFEQNATVVTKLPRILKPIQSYYRGVQTASDLWNRPESSVCPRMPF